MSAIGWVVGVGLVGGLAVLLSTSPTPSKGGTTTTSGGARYTIKRNLIDASVALPLSIFKTGDILNVTIHDGTKNIDVPNLVRVVSVGGDSIDAVYTGPEFGDVPEKGSHFTVYPRDVLLRTPGLTPGGDPSLHVLDASDVAMGPNAFAVLYGYDGIDSFKAANIGILSDVPAATTGGSIIDPTAPGTYTTSAPIPELRRLIPWEAGTNVVIKTKTLPLIKTMLPIKKFSLVKTAGEFGGRYGGKGYGGKANY